ncbi:MAG: hypothetical protein R3324_15465, partial [Halobacteriales archaeon]|nr:hypothetical protein [Halobacteriales archaeon]
RLTVPCPQCGAQAPAGIPRHVTLLAIMPRTAEMTEFDWERPSHVAARCPANHDVHVYYQRTFAPDSLPDWRGSR